MRDGKEGFGRELTEGIGEEEIGVVLGDDGEVMIAEKSVDRGSKNLVEGGCWAWVRFTVQTATLQHGR